MDILSVVIFSTRPGLQLRLAAVKIADTLGYCGSAFPNSPLCFRSICCCIVLVFHLMISYFCKLFQYFAVLCFNRNLLTFFNSGILHTLRHAPHRNLMHLICFVHTAHASGATPKMHTFASENFSVCAYANSRLPVHQPSSFVTRSSRVIDSSRPSLIVSIE